MSCQKCAQFALLLLLSGAVTHVTALNDPSPEALPLSASGQPFVKNQGQFDPQVAFTASTFAGTVFVTRDGRIISDLPVGRVPASERRVAIFEELITSRQASVVGTKPSSIKMHDLDLGPEPLESYDQLSLGELYPGIEVHLSARENNVEKIFHVAPGANPSMISVRVRGVDKLDLGAGGELLLATTEGHVAFSAPVAWQESDGRQQPIEVAYRLAPDGETYGFEVAAYDASRPLIIDPLIAGTFIGGSADERFRSVKVANGRVYVAGHSFSADFPTTPGAYDPGPGGGRRVVIARFDQSLTSLQAATYFGRGVFSANDSYQYLSMDAHNGQVYVGFVTDSASNPTPGGYDSTFNGGTTDILIARLNGDLTQLLSATYLGGSLNETLWDIDVDLADGDLCVGASTNSSDFPVTAGAHDTTHNGNVDGTATCFSADLSQLERSTYLGTSAIDRVYSIHAFSGNLICGGLTADPANFPTINGAFQSPFGSEDGFVTFLSGSGFQLVASTLIGANGMEAVRGVALHGGSVYAAGNVSNHANLNFPISGGFDVTHNGSFDVFVARFDALLSTLQSSTFLGTGDNDTFAGMDVAPDGFLHLLTSTPSSSFPTTATAFHPDRNGATPHVTLSRISPSLASMPYATYLPGPDVPTFQTLEVHSPAVNSVYFVSRFEAQGGLSGPGPYFTTANAYSPGFNTGQEGILTHLNTTVSTTEVSIGFLTIDVNEDHGELTIQATRSGDTSGLTRVRYQTEAGTATPTNDYSHQSSTLTWQPGETAPKTISIQIIDDSDIESTENFLLRLIEPVGASIALFGETRTINISDNDAAGVTVTPLGASPLQLSEPFSSTQFSVSLDAKPATFPLLITAFTNDDSEGTFQGDDGSGQLELSYFSANWDTPQIVTIEAVDDVIADGPQNFQIDFLPISSNDQNFDGIIPLSVDFVTHDDETPGLEFDPPAASLMTSEAGVQDSLSVRLTSQPASSVSVALMPDANGQDEGQVMPATLNFDASNWNSYQVATVTGLDDPFDDGNVTYQLLATSTSADPDYDQLSLVAASVENADDDSAGLVLTAPGNTTLSELPDQTQFSLALATPPISPPVNITLSASDASEIQLTGGNAMGELLLSFDTNNWNVPQLITVTSVDDAVDDGDQSVTVGFQPISNPAPDYNGLSAAGVNLVVVDDDSAGLGVAPVNPPLVTDESGTFVSITVVLESEPTAPVQVTAITDAAGLSEGAVTPATLQFSPADWQTPKTFTVTGVDDDLDDGDIEYSITLDAASTDGLYDLTALPGPLVTNLDNDTAGISLSLPQPPPQQMSESGGQVTFTVVLDTEPLSPPVELQLSSTDLSAGELSGADSNGMLTLSFDASDWSQPKNITVDAVDDDLDDGDQPFLVDFSPIGNPGEDYDGFALSSVDLITLDDDAAGLSFTPDDAPLETHESGTVDSFNLSLASEPTHTVQVQVSIAPQFADEGSAAPSSLQFSPANWSSPQSVIVSGLDDDIDDGDQPYTITLDAISDDPNYLLAPFAGPDVVNQDDDTASIVLAPLNTPIETQESGTQTFFTVRLGSEPTHSASLFLTPDSIGLSEGTLNPDMLVIGPGDWDTTQIITVSGINDDYDDGDQSYHILVDSSSSDPNYTLNGVIGPEVINHDDDIAGIDFAPMGDPLVTSEDGSSDTFDVQLTAAPQSPVLLTATPDMQGQDEGMLAPSPLSFDETNWAQPQTIVVTGLDDTDLDGDVLYQVQLSTSSDDPPFSIAIAPGPLVMNLDDDSIEVDAAISVDNGLTQVMPFEPLTYTIVASNPGDTPVAGATIATTSLRLDTASMAWTCTPQGLSLCDAPGGTGNVLVQVDLDAQSSVEVTLTTSALNHPFEQAQLTAELLTPIGVSDPNPADNFAVDSDEIFVFIVFRDGFESDQ